LRDTTVDCCIVALDVTARCVLLPLRADCPCLGGCLTTCEERMTREEALAIVRQIEGIASTFPHDDLGAQEDILELVDRLRAAPGVREVVREKVSSIAAWTDILFDDRKRQTYGGDEEVTGLLLHDCERLRAAIRGD
jgi:hypothetical protein